MPLPPNPSIHCSWIGHAPGLDPLIWRFCNRKNVDKSAHGVITCRWPTTPGEKSAQQQSVSFTFLQFNETIQKQKEGGGRLESEQALWSPLTTGFLSFAERKFDPIAFTSSPERVIRVGYSAFVVVVVVVAADVKCLLRSGQRRESSLLSVVFHHLNYVNMIF